MLRNTCKGVPMMHRKLEIVNLDIPVDDYECWNRYPRHRWVYDLSRLLDAQNLKWSPFEENGLQREINYKFYTKSPIIRQPGYIYIEPPNGEYLVTEVYILRGEIKLMRHINPVTKKSLSALTGNIEIRINAFVSLYFSKFTGVVSIETVGNQIYRISLRPFIDLQEEEDIEVIKNAKRVYKKYDILLSGPSDQVLRKEIAS